jgi:hypothetical protein
MEFLTTAVQWLVANVDVVLATLFSIEVAAVAIVNLTPTTVDNKVLRSVHSVFVVLANLIPNAKVTPSKTVAETAMKTLK